MDVTNTFKRAAAGTAIAGALSFGFLGVSGGLAAAKPGNPDPNPPGPGVSAPSNPGNGNGSGNSSYDDDSTWNGGNVNPAWVPGNPPGQNPFGPPGQVKKMPTLTLNNSIDLGNGTIIPAGTVLPNPFEGLPPGQWGQVDLQDFISGVDPVTLTWLAPGLVTPMPLVWDVTAGAWGVTVNGTFVPYPIQFPAPTG